MELMALRLSLPFESVFAQVIAAALVVGSYLISGKVMASHHDAEEQGS